MATHKVIRNRFIDLANEISPTIDEIHFTILHMEMCFETHFGPDPDERMTLPEAQEYLDTWPKTVDKLDEIALHIQQLHVHYYQKLHYPEHRPETADAIVRHGRLVCGFAIHRIQWVIDAYKSENPDKLALLTKGRRGELTYKTIGEQIGHSAAAVAHWHKSFRPLPHSSTVISKLVEFYGLSDSSDAYYWVTPKNGVLLPWHMIAHYRG